MKTQLKVLGKFDKDKMLKIPAHLGMSEVTVKDGKIPKKKKNLCSARFYSCSNFKIGNHRIMPDFYKERKIEL